MRWHSVILIAGVFLVVESAKYSHEKKSHFTSIEDDDEREDGTHMFDVKKIVKGTIDAIGGQGTTPKPDGLYSLFQLPSEILSQIASDAGYIEPTTTAVPKRKKKRRNHKTKKYRKLSEDGSYEGTYVRVDEGEDSEDDDAYKPRKKNKSKRRHHRPIYLPPNYVPPPMVSTPPLRQSLPIHQTPQQQPMQIQQVPQENPLTSLFAPLPSFPLTQLPTVSLPTFAPIVPLTMPTTTTPNPPTMAPLSIRRVEQPASPLPEMTAVGGEYAYQPVVQADGKTYYQRVLILPPTRAGDPAPDVILPSTVGVTMTTQSSTTAPPPPNSFVVEETTTTTEEPSTTEGLKRKTKIRRRLIKNAKTETPLAAEVIQQQPQSDVPSVPSASTTMRPVSITFSPNLELFKTQTPSVEIPLQEQREVKIKPRTHGARTHSVGKAIESVTSTEGLTTLQPALKYVTDEETDESEEVSPSIPTPPVPNFTPKLITTQLPSIEQQMKNNEVFSASLETAKKGSGTILTPQVTALHSIANRRLQAEDDYLPPIEENKRGKKKGKKARKERKEDRVKKVESNEIEDIKEAVEAVRREKKEKVQRRFHQEEDKKEVEKEEEEEEEIVATTQKPRRRQHKKKQHRVIEVETPEKIALSPPDDDTEESVMPTASPSSSSFRRSLAPALIDVRELNGSHRTNSPSIRHVHHAERLAVLRKSLEARARGVKQLSTQEKEEEEEEKEVAQESKSSTPLAELFPSTTTEIARKKSRRHRKRKTTVAPTTTTTTTTEVPTTTEETSESYELNDDESEEAEHSYEVDDNGEKIEKKETRVTTTTQAPTTTSSSSKKLKVLRPHCLNIRSFARQFGMADVFEFVDEHCSFIENYYPSLTCDRRDEYLAFCAGVWDTTKI